MIVDGKGNMFEDRRKAEDKKKKGKDGKQTERMIERRKAAPQVPQTKRKKK